MLCKVAHLCGFEVCSGHVISKANYLHKYMLQECLDHPCKWMSGFLFVIWIKVTEKEKGHVLCDIITDILMR